MLVWVIHHVTPSHLALIRLWFTLIRHFTASFLKVLKGKSWTDLLVHGRRRKPEQIIWRKAADDATLRVWHSSTSQVEGFPALQLLRVPREAEEFGRKSNITASDSFNTKPPPNPPPPPSVSVSSLAINLLTSVSSQPWVPALSWCNPQQYWVLGCHGLQLHLCHLFCLAQTLFTDWVFIGFWIWQQQIFFRDRTDVEWLHRKR